MNIIFRSVLIFCASICDANSEDLPCNHEKSITRLNSLRYTTCLIQDKKGEKTVGIRYVKTNVSHEPIEIFVEKSNLYRFWIRILDGKKEIFSTSEIIFDTDTYIPKPRVYKIEKLKPGESFSDQISFQDLAGTVKKNNPKIDFNKEFRLSFFISPTFLRANESGNAYKAMMFRKKESEKIAIPETSRLGYENIFIDWN